MLRIETNATNEMDLKIAKDVLVRALNEISADGLAPMVNRSIEDGDGRTVYMLTVSY